MTGEEENDSWPLPKFFFSVSIGDDIPFKEVSGLDAEAQPIAHRAGDAKLWSVIRMPGLIKAGNVTLKKGVVTNSDAFWNWHSEIQLNTIKRQSITISLLDQNGKATMVWTLANAWPTKITGTDRKADGNEVAVETLEIAHAQLTIANSG